MNPIILKQFSQGEPGRPRPRQVAIQERKRLENPVPTRLGIPPPVGQNDSMVTHLVRYSLLGQVGQFVSTDATHYPRSTRVIVRTSRGLEIGEVLANLEADRTDPHDGQILRLVTVEDDLLAARLEKHRQRAFEACSELLASQQIPAQLVDVEHTFDGQGLFFYFLGEVPPSTAHIMAQLADTYETAVEFRQFVETLTTGCGPGCGTEEAAGQGGCSTCTTCAVAGACGAAMQRA